MCGMHTSYDTKHKSGREKAKAKLFLKKDTLEITLTGLEKHGQFPSDLLPIYLIIHANKLSPIFGPVFYLMCIEACFGNRNIHFEPNFCLTCIFLTFAYKRDELNERVEVDVPGGGVD